jgi:transposase InsO family protein
VDITGPSEATSGKILLTVIDLFSRYPDVFVLRSSSSSEIISNLRKWFSQFGMPENLLSDNGTPFVSSEMHLFLQSIGVHHLRSANFHPQSNGCIERFHRTLKTRLKRILLSQNVTFECALDKVSVLRHML